MHRVFLRGLLAATAAAAIGGFLARSQPAPDARAQGAAPERIDTGKACYVQLPNLPDARYGGFGGYNAGSGVLAFAGGATKFGANETRAYPDLYAIRLDGKQAAWQSVPYSANVGYTSNKSDRGCREMATVALNATNWLSVFGKDGCDGANTAAVDSGAKGSNGDVKELAIGDTANGSGVRWVTNSGVNSLPSGTYLKDNKGKLVRLFAAYDTTRDRVIFGQGTYNDEVQTESQDVVFSAKKSGSKWNVQQLSVAGAKPDRRMGSCAAYVYDKDSGTDGVIVLGGHTGGLSTTGSTFNEVWWIDFTSSASGVWQDITARFSNQTTPDADGISFGGRREGACAYDPDTKMFYSWFGRASASIKDGASHSTGLWRADLSKLGDAATPLKWERLAPDNLETTTNKKIRAVRSIPSVWDSKYKRFFVLGGRASGNDGNESVDQAWALYPDVTGEACASLDPYAPFRAGPTATTGPGATNTPGTGPTTPPRPTSTPGVLPTPDGSVLACANLEVKAPAAAIAQALSAPSSLSGYMMPCNPNVPISPVNPLRRYVTLRNINLPYHPLYNGFVLRCGCQ
ncbi:MAG: hypothetical protein U0470_14645 [Anaerolineae bacterium]